jgi:hypothetical protein
VVAVSNTVETAHEFRSGTQAFTLKCNEFENIRISWQTGEVTSGSGDWMLLYPGETYWEDEITLGVMPGMAGQGEVNESIYLHAPDASASVDVAIKEWR